MLMVMAAETAGLRIMKPGVLEILILTRFIMTQIESMYLGLVYPSIPMLTILTVFPTQN